MVDGKLWVILIWVLQLNMKVHVLELRIQMINPAMYTTYSKQM